MRHMKSTSGKFNYPTYFIIRFFSLTRFDFDSQSFFFSSASYSSSSSSIAPLTLIQEADALSVHSPFIVHSQRFVVDLLPMPKPIVCHREVSISPNRVVVARVRWSILQNSNAHCWGRRADRQTDGQSRSEQMRIWTVCDSTVHRWHGRFGMMERESRSATTHDTDTESHGKDCE